MLRQLDGAFDSLTRERVIVAVPNPCPLFPSPTPVNELHGGVETAEGRTAPHSMQLELLYRVLEFVVSESLQRGRPLLKRGIAKV